MAYGSPPPPGRPGAPGAPGAPGYGPTGTRQFPGPYGYRAGAPSAPTPDGRPSHNDRSWALMAYLGQLFVGFVAPGIVYLARGRSPFVRAHAAQGLNLGIAMTVGWVVGWLLSSLATSILWVPVGYTALGIFFMIKSAMAANQGGWYRSPAVMAWR